MSDFNEQEKLSADTRSIYDDEQLASKENYEELAKAYSLALKERGFMIVQIDGQDNSELVHEIFVKLFNIKSLLFTLGGFLNTSKFYSLNERQLKKLAILFDFEENISPNKSPYDKTKCLLSFLSLECLLIKDLFELAEKSSYESQIKDMINSRLNLLSQILVI